MVAMLGLIGLTSCEKSNGESSGSKNAVSLLDKVIGQDIASASKTVESFGIPFWEKNGDGEYDWRYIFTDGESETSVPVVRLFVSNDIVCKAEYQLENAGNQASCDNTIITWGNQLNNHKIGENDVWFIYANSGQRDMDDFSKLSDFIKSANVCNVYFNVGGDHYTIGRITIRKEYEDNDYDDDFYFSILTYEWKK